MSGSCASNEVAWTESKPTLDRKNCHIMNQPLMREGGSCQVCCYVLNFFIVVGAGSYSFFQYTELVI